METCRRSRREGASKEVEARRTEERLPGPEVLALSTHTFVWSVPLPATLFLLSLWLPLAFQVSVQTSFPPGSCPVFPWLHWRPLQVALAAGVAHQSVSFPKAGPGLVTAPAVSSPRALQ